MLRKGYHDLVDFFPIHCPLLKFSVLMGESDLQQECHLLGCLIFGLRRDLLGPGLSALYT